GDPGSERQIDFGYPGCLVDPASGRRRKVHALIFTAVYSRHMFVWLTYSQTLAAVIAGCEAAWTFLKLGALKDTLPERVALARQHRLSHVAFLELLLADEGSRRESRSAALQSAKAGLDRSMRIDTWNALDDLRYDRSLLSDLVSLWFAEAGHSVLVLGPVGVGKTRLATALGHVAIRRRMT
ncbi:ATP-binding protein, partial [Rhodococcus sp. NCIMB 12038]|uniref:ATP-binding protein n=1 Tax=Rhodococcus sp. NCIMB 12038 TaxID=933800 RepID=UPI00211B723C